MRTRLQFLTLFLLLGCISHANTIVQCTGNWGTGPYADICVYQQYAFVTTGEAGIDILDISDPEDVRRAGRLSIENPVTQIAVSGNWLIVGTDFRYASSSNKKHMLLFDISTATEPVEVDTFEFSLDDATYTYNNNISQILACGTTIYVLTSHADFETDKLWVITIDPETGLLRFETALEFYDTLFDICLEGDYLYLAGEEHGLRVLDVTDPLSPVRLEPTIDRNLESLTIDTDRGLLIAADNSPGDEGVRIYSISNPAEPELLSRALVPFTPKQVLSSTKNSIFVTGTREVATIDVSEPSSPKISHLDNCGFTRFETNFSGLEIHDNLLLVAFGLKGLFIYDIRQAPSDVSRVSQFDQSVEPTHLFADQDRLYLVCKHEGLLSLSLDENRQLREQGMLLIEEDVLSAAYSHGVLVLTVPNEDQSFCECWANAETDPTNLEKTAVFLAGTYEGYTTTSACEGLLCVVSTGKAELFDIGNPRSPRLLTFTTIEDFHLPYFTPHPLTMTREYIIVSSLGALSTFTYDETGIELLTKLVSYPVNCYSDGQLVYANETWRNQMEIDIWDPENLNIVNSIFVPEDTEYVAARNGRLIAGTTEGLHIIDSSSPDMPQYEGMIGRPVTSDLVSFMGEDQIVATGTNGIVDIYHIQQGVWIPHIDWSDEWSSFLIADNTSAKSIELTIRTYGEETNEDLVTIPPRESAKIPLNHGTCGEVTYVGSGLYLKESFVNNRQHGVAEFELSGAVYPTLTYPLPHYLGENHTWSGIAVCNPWNLDMAATISAYAPDGTLLGEIRRTIPMRSRLVGYIETFFPELHFQDVSSISIASEHGLCGLTISGHENERLLFAPASANGITSTDLWISHISTEWDYWNNRIILDGIGPDVGHVQLRLYGENSGSPWGTTSYRFIVEPHQTVVIDLKDYISKSPTCGQISVASSLSRVVVRQSYEYTQTGAAAEFILKARAHNRLVFNFPAYAKEELNWMGLAIMNTGEVPDSITLYAFRNGYPVAQTSVDIPSEDRMAFLLQDLFPDAAEEGIDRVIAIGTQPLSGINISGFNQERYLFTPAFPNKQN